MSCWVGCFLRESGAFLKQIETLTLLKLIPTLRVHKLSCVFQVKPSVVPLLQALLTEGTFQASSLDSGAASSTLSGGGGGGEQREAGAVEECAARLVFTSEKPLPWLEKLATQIKASRENGNVRLSIKQKPFAASQSCWSAESLAAVAVRSAILT